MSADAGGVRSGRPLVGGVMALTCALLLVTAPAVAQLPDPEVQDTLVRVTLHTDSTVEGVLRSSAEADPLRIEIGGEVVDVPAADLQRVELGRARTRGRGFARGAGIGALITGGLSAALFVASGLDPDYGGAGAIPIVAGVYAVPGALIGGVIGAIEPGVRWAPATGYGAEVGLDSGVGGTLELTVHILVRTP